MSHALEICLEKKKKAKDNTVVLFTSEHITTCVKNKYTELNSLKRTNGSDQCAMTLKIHLGHQQSYGKVNLKTVDHHPNFVIYLF